MSGPKPPRLCPKCRFLSPNGKVCHVQHTHPFKHGICRGFEPKEEHGRVETAEDGSTQPLGDGAQ